jgi:transposase InsO family protein
LFIEPSIPWENGYIESFNGKLRNECLDGELFLCLSEAKYIVDRWRLDYNYHRPHRLDWITPAAYAALCPIKVVATKTGRSDKDDKYLNCKMLRP